MFLVTNPDLQNLIGTLGNIMDIELFSFYAFPVNSISNY
jgi:hypothetical protein